MYPRGRENRPCTYGALQNETAQRGWVLEKVGLRPSGRPSIDARHVPAFQILPFVAMPCKAAVLQCKRPGSIFSDVYCTNAPQYCVALVSCAECGFSFKSLQGVAGALITGSRAWDQSLPT